MVVFPNAKINLGLRVTRKRDDGYHDIETIFYTVRWCDILEAIPDNSPGAKSISLTVTGNNSLSAEDNLCARAYDLLSKDFRLPPVKAWLHKIIPIGAGLGGGSSDAAFMLTLLNKLFSLGISNNKMKQYALSLGSDCSFFVDNKPAFAGGRGEVMAEIPQVLKNYFTFIVKPGFSVSTAEAYRMVIPVRPETSLKDLISLPVSEWKNKIVNDFETPLAEKYPEINFIKRKFYESGALFALMSGSGSCVYGIYKTEADVSNLFPGYQCWKGIL